MITKFIVFWTLTFVPNFQGPQQLMLHRNFSEEKPMLEFLKQQPKEKFECINYDMNGQCFVSDFFIQKYDGKKWRTEK